MANVLSAALNPEIWSALMQVNLTKTLVALEVADTTLEAQLKVGDKIHVPYITALADTPYVAGTAITFQDMSATDDYLDVNTFRVVPFYVDDIELLQAKPDYVAAYAEDAAYQLRDAIDTSVLAEVSAGILFGDVTATPGTYATGTAATLSAAAASTGIIVEFFSSGRKALREGNVSEDGDWIAIMEPGVASIVEQLAVEKGFQVADATLRGGYAGDFMGFHCYVSNNMVADYMYLGKRGGISLVMQRAPKMDIKDVSDKLGRNFIASAVYGQKTFTKNAKRFLRCMISS